LFVLIVRLLLAIIVPVSGLSDQLSRLLVLSERAVSAALVQSELLVLIRLMRLGRDDRPLVRAPIIRHLAGRSFLLLLWLLSFSGLAQALVPGPQLRCQLLHFSDFSLVRLKLCLLGNCLLLELAKLLVGLLEGSIQHVRLALALGHQASLILSQQLVLLIQLLYSVL